MPPAKELARIFETWAYDRHFKGWGAGSFPFDSASAATRQMGGFTAGATYRCWYGSGNPERVVAVRPEPELGEVWSDWAYVGLGFLGCVTAVVRYRRRRRDG